MVDDSSSAAAESADVVVLGGGAAGFFAAIVCAEENPARRVFLLERSGRLLSKVLISGGGRCNVTHACFDPAQLVTFYPRGGKALRGPFSRFQPSDTIEWFSSRGVELKTEPDGRLFPTTDRSQTIYDCLTEQARQAGVAITLNARVSAIAGSDRQFTLTFDSGKTLLARAVILASGSNPLGWEWARALGHTIEPPVPSLFTFTLKDARLAGLSGVSVPAVELRLENAGLTQTGALLVTHWGLSGPAVLKLSAWGARPLHDAAYHTSLKINWLPAYRGESLRAELQNLRRREAKKSVHKDNPFGIPQRLWARLAEAAQIPSTCRWADLSNERLAKFYAELHEGLYEIVGKGVFKEEFVTCGGVRLDEVDFRTLESKRCAGLYFAGEVLDIDGVTGGFNFQNAWTTGWLAGKAAARVPD